MQRAAHGRVTRILFTRHDRAAEGVVLSFGTAEQRRGHADALA